jgi:RIO kinase 1
MYHQCKLVHADLSEYNILYHESHLYIIDVSQSVEHDHPSAFDFLRNDIKNVEDFFGRLGVTCLGLRRCFEFVTKDTVGAPGEDEGAALAQWLANGEVTQDASANETVAGTAERDVTGTSAISAHEDSVFFRSFIPRSLNEVYDPERDVALLNQRGSKALIYGSIIGLVEQAPGKANDLEQDTAILYPNAAEADKQSSVKENERSKPRVRFVQSGVASSGSEENQSGEDEGSEPEEDEDIEDGEDGHVERKPRGHRHEDRDVKKVCSVEFSIFHCIDSRMYFQGAQKGSQGSSKGKTKNQASQGREEA